VATGCLEVRAVVSTGVPDREASSGPVGRRFDRPGDERERDTWQGVSQGCGAHQGSRARLGVRVRRRGGSDAWRRSGARGAVASATSCVPARTVAVEATLTRFF
jgi:hypothetical protein